MIEIEYEVRTVGGGTEVKRGVQVGRFAYRSCAGEVAIARFGDRALRPYGPGAHFHYKVDHVPSGIGVVSGLSLEQAIEVADSLSLHASVDPDATTPEAFGEQLGPELRAWLNSMRTAHVPFREWRAKRVEAAGGEVPP